MFPIKTFVHSFENNTILTKPILYVYGKGWKNSLLSFDMDCLAIQVCFPLIKDDCFFKRH